MPLLLCRWPLILLPPARHTALVAIMLPRLCADSHADLLRYAAPRTMLLLLSCQRHTLVAATRRVISIITPRAYYFTISMPPLLLPHVAPCCFHVDADAMAAPLIAADYGWLFSPADTRAGVFAMPY